MPLTFAETRKQALFWAAAFAFGASITSVLLFLPIFVNEATTPHLDEVSRVYVFFWYTGGFGVFFTAFFWLQVFGCPEENLPDVLIFFKRLARMGNPIAFPFLLLWFFGRLLVLAGPIFQRPAIWLKIVW